VNDAAKLQKIKQTDKRTLAKKFFDYPDFFVKFAVGKRNGGAKPCLRVKISHKVSI